MLISRIVITIGLLVLGATTVLASTYVPFTYTIESRDRRFLFVMLSPLPILEDAPFLDYSPSGRVPSQVDRTREVRAKYPHSGLYRNDGSSTPLWTLNQYSPYAALSSDGVHLSSLNGYVVGGLSEEGLVFYENGEEIRRYSVGDLVGSIKDLSWSFDGYGWLKGFSFDDGSNTLLLTLVNGERYSFDIKSGNIVRIERNPKKFYVAVLVGSGFLLLALTVWIIIRRF